MIISASRRTDIPAFYSDWLVKRVQAGFVLVRNPMNCHQISKVSLAPELVECFVFWTKNPQNMLDKLKFFDSYHYYFQFTLNSYGKAIECNVPAKKAVIETFIKLSETIGANRVIWRYDPIIITDKITKEYHYKYFKYLAAKLYRYTHKCVISYVDFYRHTKNNMKCTKIKNLQNEEALEIATHLAQIAKSYGLKIESCAESMDLSSSGIEPGKCIDDKLVSELLGSPVLINKDKQQRAACGCAESIDIGAYNTCLNNCVYCYANYNMATVRQNHFLHQVGSPLLTGELQPADKVTIRSMSPCKLAERSLFDK